MSHRAQDPARYAPGGVNVSPAERVASALFGGCAVLRGLRKFASGSMFGGLLTTGIGGYLTYRGYTGRCSLYKRLNAASPGEMSHPLSREIRVERAITINRSAENLFTFWKDLTNLPRVMSHIERVEILGERRSRWTVRGPGDMTAQWDAVLTEEVANERLAWVTVDGCHVDHRGSVSFRPAGEGRGTIVEVRLTYRPLGGAVTALLARLFQSDPDLEIRDDLRRFKQFMETGEVADSTGPSARAGTGQARRMMSRPATESPKVGAPKMDDVAEASDESFPASDPPAWAGR